MIFRFLQVRVDDQPVTNREIVEIALFEGTQRIFGSTNNRLTMHIETGIDQRGYPGEFIVRCRRRRVLKCQVQSTRP